MERGSLEEKAVLPYLSFLHCDFCLERGCVAWSFVAKHNSHLRELNKRMKCYSLRKVKQGAQELQSLMTSLTSSGTPTFTMLTN